MSRLLRSFPALLLLAALGACADSGGGNGPDASQPREGYPGCYGTTEGSIMSDLEFVGIDGEPFTLGEVYRDGHNRLLMINSSAGWCSVCIEEQPALVALHEQYAEHGLFILVSLFENASFAPADHQTASRWREQYDLPFTVVADPAFLLGDFYDASLTPMNMLVDVETMEIIRIATGYDATLIEAIIEAKLL